MPLELIRHTIGILDSIRELGELSQGKFGDKEFEEHFRRTFSGDLKKAALLLNGLFNYIKVTTPARKANIVHAVIEKVTKKHQARLDTEKISVVQKFEEELPETIVPEAHFTYVLDSILQYAMASMPRNGSIGFLTKSHDLIGQGGEVRASSLKDRKWVEILVILIRSEKPSVQSEMESGFSPSQKKEVLPLELQLVKEIVRRNKGIMKVEEDQKKARTFISLRFPAERRSIFYYPPADNQKNNAEKNS